MGLETTLYSFLILLSLFLFTGERDERWRRAECRSIVRCVALIPREGVLFFVAAKAWRALDKTEPGALVTLMARGSVPMLRYADRPRVLVLARGDLHLNDR